MYKVAETKEQKRKISLKAVAVLILAIGMIVLMVKGTYAYRTMRIKQVNMIKPALSNIELIKNIQGKTLKKGENILKGNLAVKNAGTVPCYVRVFLKPSDEINMNTEFCEKGSDWEKRGDFYYFKEVLQPEKETSNLFRIIKIDVKDDPGDGCDIISYAESIIAEDGKGKDKGYEKAWNIK